MTASLKGRLLLATPSLLDPNFARTVVLVCAHDDDGAMGVIINRPSDLAVGAYLPDWAESVGDFPVVFEGGPVQREVAIGVGVQEPGSEPVDGWTPIGLGLGLVALERHPSDFPALGPVRVYSGYAGWAGGQLELELAVDGWFVADAQHEDVLDAEPATLWRRVLRRQPGRLSLYADFPLDLATN